MRLLKGIVESGLIFVAFPIACFVVVGGVMAVGVTAFFIWLGAMLAAWLIFAFVVPMLFGAVAPSEIVDNIRSRRVNETHHEGEPLLKSQKKAPHLEVSLEVDLLSLPGAPRAQQNGARS